MKRVSILLLLLLAFIMADAQKLDVILEKTAKALGESARDKISNLESGGYVMMTGTEARMPFKLVQSKPDKIRIETTVFGFKAIQTYNGKNAWLLNPTQGLDPKPADPEDMEFISATTSIDGPFKNNSNGRIPELIGNKEYKGVPCFVLRVTKSPEEHIDHYIDAETFLIAAIRYEYKKNGGWYSMEYKVEEYEDFEGARFPGEITVFINGVEMTSIFVTRMKVLDKVSESLFEKPSY